MTGTVELEGHGTNSVLADDILVVRAVGLFGKGALGAAERVIPVGQITAIEFREATALINGSVTLDSAVGKTILHFRRKQAGAARGLYEALLARSGASPDARVTSSFASEGRDARASLAAERRAQSRARLAERGAQLESDRLRARAEFEASRAELRASAKADWADLRTAWSRTPEAAPTPRLSELAALLDAAERADALEGEDPPVDLGGGFVGAEGDLADFEVPVEVAAGRLEPPVGELASSPFEESQILSEESAPRPLQDPPEEEALAAAVQAGPTVLEKAVLVLEEAELASEVGDMAEEERQIRTARSTARSLGRRRDRKEVEAEIERRIRQGTLRRGARRLGVIRSEGALDWWLRTQTLTPGSRGEKVIDVWSDRIITGRAVYPISALTTAQVYLDGEETITQRPTLTRMALFAPLPGSALIPGLAFQKKEVKDRRSAEVQIRDVNWALTAALNPDGLSEPRRLADQINSLAAAMAATPPSSSGAADVLMQLERLAFLVQKGIITATEAASIKAALLR